MDCIEYIDSNISVAPYGLLALTNPINSFVWAPRSMIWKYAFTAFTGVYSFFFFFLGFVSVTMLIKQDCLRLKTKTFLAIYICLAILGFSHAVHLALDPYGILGWIIQYFPQWTIISRSLVILGFPSLTASYTLVFITLYKSVELGSSRLWHQDWRVVGLLVTGHYTVVIVAEAVANTAGYPALVTVVICECGFAVWGVVMCFIYLFAGRRLLRKLKDQCEASVRMSTSVSSRDQWKRARQESQSVLSEEHYNRQYSKISHTLRKVAILTYFTSLLTILYAVVSMISLFFTSWLIFYQCFGLNGVSDPVVWLVLQETIKTIELFLSILMLYSVTDLKALIGTIMKCGCCCKVNTTGCTARDATGPTTTPLPNTSSLVSLRTKVEVLQESTTVVPHQHIIPISVIVHSSTDDYSLPAVV